MVEVRSSSYTSAMPGIKFPKDEKVHPQAMEWWYWNGHLKDRAGLAYAFMASLFKVKLPALKPVWFLHSFISSVKGQKFYPDTRLFFRGLDQGSMAGGKLKASARGYFSMRQESLGKFSLEIPHLRLRLLSEKPPLPTGGTGELDFKTSKSCCYSLTRLQVQGELELEGKRKKVRGLAWMDHQWSPLALDQEHVWTWFALQLNDGTELSCFEYGRKIKTRLATLSRPDGSVAVTKRVRLVRVGLPWISPKTGAQYPLHWKISLPEFGLEVATRPLLKNQEMLFGPLNYWEGPLKVVAKSKGKKIGGVGFLEIVGVPWGKSILRVIAQQAFS